MQTKVDLTQLFHSTSKRPKGFNFVRVLEPGSGPPDRSGGGQARHGVGAGAAGTSVQRLIYDDQPYTFIAVPMELTALDDRFCNVTPSAISFFVNLPAWRHAARLRPLTRASARHDHPPRVPQAYRIAAVPDLPLHQRTAVRARPQRVTAMPRSNGRPTGFTRTVVSMRHAPGATHRPQTATARRARCCHVQVTSVTALAAPRGECAARSHHGAPPATKT